MDEWRPAYHHDGACVFDYAADLSGAEGDTDHSGPACCNWTCECASYFL